MAIRYAQSRTVDYQLIIRKPYGGKPERDTGLWPKAEGGQLTGEEIKYGEYPVATGTFSRENISLRRPFDQDSAELESWLEAARGADVTLIRSQRGDDLASLDGRVRTFTGQIISVMGPAADVTTSERSELMVELVVNVPAS